VKNRGTQPADDVVVKVFQGDPTGGLVWPTGWQAVTTTRLPAAGPILAGGQMVVGPFEWMPQIPGQESLLASASVPGDLCNADTVNGAIPHWRLVPFDNYADVRVMPMVA
jgi:zinc metalloprotease ZmpB